MFVIPHSASDHGITITIKLDLPLLECTGLVVLYQPSKCKIYMANVKFIFTWMTQMIKYLYFLFFVKLDRFSLNFSFK